MAATVSGSKTVNNSPAPHLPASTLTTLMNTALENLTVAQFEQISDALNRIAKGKSPTATIGSLIS